MFQSFGLVKVHLGVDACALFGNALFEGLGDGCGFSCGCTVVTLHTRSVSVNTISGKLKGRSNPSHSNNYIPDMILERNAYGEKRNTDYKTPQ